MSFVSSWRTALRIAHREARRSKGRSALVVAMIAAPVLCLSFAAVTYDMFSLTTAERADRLMGTADARLSWQSHLPVNQTPDGESYPADYQAVPTPDQSKPGTTAELSTVLPAGTTVLPVRKGTADMRTADGIGQLNAISVDARSPLVNGYLTLLQGRAPVTASEIALSEKAVTRLGTGIGGPVTSADGRRSYTVVGLVEFPSQLEQTLLFAPITGDLPDGMDLGDQTWLVDTPSPLDWSQVQELNRRGIGAASRDVMLNPPPASDTPIGAQVQAHVEELALGTLVGGLALLEIILLAGPAFAVSARRRQRQLALVAANGGTPAHVRRIVLADGVVLGLVGAGVGIVAGVLTAFGARPLIEEHLAAYRAGAYRVFPTALLAIALLAVGTGLLAALVPAFITARQNVIAALAGRRGVTRSRKRWLVLGLVMVGAGTFIAVSGTFRISANVMLAGFVLGELGLVLCTPSLVGLIARMGRILPVAPRIALRDAARNRAAAAPAISAVMAAVAGSVALGLYFESNRAQQETGYIQSIPVGSSTVYFPEKQKVGADPAHFEAAARATLPVSTVNLISVAQCPTTGQTDSGGGGTGTGTTEDNGAGPVAKPAPQEYCWAQVIQDPATLCPYQTVVSTQHRDLTQAEARAANADPRCRHPFESRARGPFGDLTVDDGTALASLTAAAPADLAAATAVLKAGGIVVTDPRYLTNGTVTLAVVRFHESTDGSSSNDPADHVASAPHVTFPGYLLSTPVNGAGPVLSPAAAARAGLTTVVRGMIVSTSRFPTQAEQDRYASRIRPLGSDGYVQPPVQYRRDTTLWIIMGAAAAITLGAAGIGTGLAAADGRADLSTLAAVGASPRLRRGLSLSQSGVIAGLGSLLGAAAGLGAAIAVLVALNQRYFNIWPAPDQYPVLIPWLSLGVALLLVPSLAMAGAGLLTRSRLPIERRI